LFGSSIGYSSQEDDWWDGNQASPDDIYIADDHDKTLQAFEGSADDEFPGSGMGDGSDGDDDEDDYATDGSGSKSLKEKTRCQTLQEQMVRKPVAGAYVPRCTDDGRFESVQCDAESDTCWCVNKQGEEVEDSVVKSPEHPDCPVDGPILKTRLPPSATEPIEKVTSTEPNEVEFESSKDGSQTKIDSIPSEVEIETVSPNSKEINSDILQRKQEDVSRMNIVGQPGILAGIIGGAVVGLLCAVLLVMFIVYRMRKKDEGSYALDEPKRSPQHAYTRAKNQEFFA